MTSEEYRQYMREQVAEAGRWMVNNADNIVADINGNIGLEVRFIFDNEVIFPNVEIKQTYFPWGRKQNDKETI